ncbi:unnamed protein product [Sympodiomycopsis kandeliae]
MPPSEKAQSKKVQHWLSKSADEQEDPYDSEADDMAPSSSNRNADSSASLSSLLQDWDSYLASTSRNVLASSTRLRGETLEQLRRIVESEEIKLTSDQHLQLLNLLFQTHPRYSDRASRLAVQAVIRAILIADEGSLSPDSKPATSSAIKLIVSFLHKETEQSCKIASNGRYAAALTIRTSLLSFACTTFTVAYQSFESPVWKPLLIAFGNILDSLLGEERTGKQRGSLSSTLVLARRTIRDAHPAIPSVIQTLTSVPAAPTAPRLAPLLGLVCDVSLRLRIGKEKEKGSPDGVGRNYVKASRQQIIDFYTTHILPSKAALPRHQCLALSDFFTAELTEDDLASTIRPSMEKLLVRSAEVSLPIEESFFYCWHGDTSTHLKALTPPILSATKSSVALTRSKAVSLFTTLCSKADTSSISRTVVDELITLIKTGKTSSADQKAAVYSMLGAFKKSQELSIVIADSVSSLLSQEITEASFRAAIESLLSHLSFCLQQGSTAEASKVGSIGQVLGKMLQHSKVPLRKIASLTIGDALWSLPDQDIHRELLSVLADSLVAGLEHNLSNASTNTLTSAAGPLEGYVALALIQGPFASSASSSKIEQCLKKNSIMQSVLSTNPKPSFLLSEKVHRKFNTEDEEVWLLRALQSALVQRATDIKTDEACQAAIAAALIHCGLVTLNAKARQEAARVVQNTARKDSRLTAKIVSSAVLTWSRAKSEEERPAIQEEASRSFAKPLRSLLGAAASLSPEATQEEKREVLGELLICAHLPQLEDPKGTAFEILSKQANISAQFAIEGSLEHLLSICRSASAEAHLQVAALSAISMLATVAPELVVAELVGDVENSISLEAVRAITADDFGILATPAGTTYVDVLTDSKDAKATIDKNRKDAKIEQWEAELRADLARKKAAENKSLTNEQKAKVEAQLKVESARRADIGSIQANLKRALNIVVALVNARSDEIDSYLPSLISLIRNAIEIPQARQLAQVELLSAFAAVCSRSSPRLAEYGLFLQVVLLRSIDESLVGEDFHIETIREQALRILYRLRSLAEQTPLDLPSVSIASPFLSLVITQGGVGVTTEEDHDGVLEQIQLALDIIDFHAGSCADVRFPRGEFIDNLVVIVAKYSQLARDAVGTLRSLGEAMKESALPTEIEKLLKHALAQETYVRQGALQAIQSLDLTELEFPSELWLACHDPVDAENARLADRCWEENGLDVPELFAAQLLSYLEDDREYVRRACGKSLAGAIEVHPEALQGLLAELSGLYRERNRVLTIEYDQFGMVIESTRNRQDPWHIRAAVAQAFEALAPLLQAEDLEPFFEFLIRDEALGDRSEEVRQKILDASSAVIDLHGNKKLSELVSRFESFLATPPPPSDALDGVLEAVVILLGRLARHLKATDKRILSIVERLFDALKTPSEMVQVAVADCLPALVPSIKDEVPRLMQRTFNDLFLAAKYAERRGAAYGLAGLIKGRGISAMSEFGVMQQLSQAITDKTNASTRQSAVECYGILAASLGRLFEPYLIEGGVLPQLIASFGDSKTEVRDATEETAKVIMQHVSAYCAKLMMPTLLEGLDEKQWRTKKGAIELLGAYSSAAPNQLAAALPTVIPRLSGVLSDAHPQVRAAGNRSLKQFGSVMKNPEVKSMVPTLLQALVDPTSKTAPALNRLLSQTFAHYLDAPSLALVIPIVDRGLRDRSAQVQRDGAKITGNLASLTDAKDLRGHLGRLMPLIREVLVSPVPEARAEAARALGVLVERLGEIQFPELVPSLMAQLRGANVTGVDRQGAAQGLSEVLAALGMDRLEALLPSVLDNTSSPHAHVREGGIALLIYLPGTFGAVRFGPYVSRIVAPILNGLADVSDAVREMSMRAGRMIIGSFSSTAIDLLLPELQQSMFDDTPRIRLSSLSLCSELLFRVGGISGKNTLEGDEADADETPEESVVVSNSVQGRLRSALGEERFSRTMATIFCLRQDPAFNVRDAAASTWKAIVVNTPRTIRDLLTMITDLVIRALSKDGEDQKEIASRTLGELTRKLGASVLEEVVPLLQDRGSDNGSSTAVRSGVMLAVQSLLENATEAQLEDHEDALIGIVRSGLVDRSDIVREAAASAFDSLQDVLGQTAIEEIIPTLLGALQERESNPDSSLADTALAALTEVMRTRADVVFPASLPTLLVQPISAFNARALGDLVGVAGKAINKKLATILGALSTASDAEEDEDTLQAIQDSIDSVLGAVNNYEALHQLMMILLGWAGDAEKDRRRIVHACNFFATFAGNVAEKGGGRALEDYNADWLRRLVTLLDDKEDDVVEAALPALQALVEAMEDPEEVVIPLRHTLSGLTDDVRGLTKKEGFGSCSAIFLAGLMSGTGEQKEQAALGLGVLVQKSSADAVKPFVTTGLAGPLIRACGERHAAAVKAAILSTLDVCLKVIPQFLKPFYPQLSRSFLKAVGDPTGLAVRNQAGISLGTLATIAGVRLDLNTLLAGARSGIVGESGTTDYPDGSALALSHVLLNIERNNSQVEAVKGDIVELIEGAFSGSEEEKYKVAIGEVVAGLALHDEDAVKRIVERRILVADTDSALASLSLASLMEHAADVLYNFGHAPKLAKTVADFVFAGPGIARPAREAKELMKARNPWASDDAVMSALSA